MSAKGLLGDNDYPIPIGCMTFYCGNNPPSGWLKVAGQEVAIAQYPALYDILGNQFGTPSNPDNFLLPNVAGSATGSDGKLPLYKATNTGVVDAGLAGTANLSFTLTEANMPNLPNMDNVEGNAYGITQSGGAWTSLVNSGRSVADNDTSGGQSGAQDTDDTFVPYNTPVQGVFNITPTQAPDNISQPTAATAYSGTIALDGEVPKRYEMPIIIKAFQPFTTVA
jgi:microcystin-dependent protein